MGGRVGWDVIHWHFLGKGIFRDISSDDVLPEVASALS